MYKAQNSAQKLLHCKEVKKFYHFFSNDWSPVENQLTFFTEISDFVREIMEKTTGWAHSVFIPEYAASLMAEFKVSYVSSIDLGSPLTAVVLY